MASPDSKTENWKLKTLVSALLAWFATDARDLPWRRTRDPYAIWVSEIMLQQTQVKTVIAYWERWLRELPTIQAAAEASPAKLHKLWEGLGYYTRVRNLQKAAQQIVAEHGDRFPEKFEDVLALSGIGRYTAGAICSIAFNQPTPLLDGNVIRVLTRIFGIASDPREKQTNAQLWQLATELVEEAATHSSRSSRSREAGETHSKTKKDKNFSRLAGSAATEVPNCSHLNQSLMELGALICTPRAPNCLICPARELCVAAREGRQEELPNLGKRAAATAREFVAFVIEHQGKFLVRQRPEGVVNAHLWEFPNVEVAAPSSRGRESAPISTAVTAPDLSSAANALGGLKLQANEPFCTIKHSITRYRITLSAYRAELPRSAPAPEGQWRTLPELHELAFTAAHKKILRAVDKVGNR